MNRQSLHKIVCGIAIMASDVVAWCCVAALFKLPREGTLVIAGVWGLGSLLWLRSYSRRVTFWNELKLEIKGMAMMALLLALALLLANRIHMLNGVINLVLSITALVLVLRTATRWVLIKTGLYAREVMIFGTGDNAKQAAKAMVSDATLGYVIRGFVCTGEPLASPMHGVETRAWPKTEQDFAHYRHYLCVVALEDEQRDLGAEIMRDLALWGAHDVHVIPSIRGVPLYGMDVSHFFSHDVLMIHLRYQLARPLRRACKRSFDIVVSALLLLLLSPLFAVLMYKISRDGGSPFYGHGRIGKGGRKFDCYKFRSMILNSQQVLQEVLRTDPQARAEWERDFKLKNDPRITAVGHFLRRTSLDELPQLWNVLKGDMSLVGPRPIVQAELERYKKDVGFYLLDKPGMTGLWQISGRNDVDYKTRVYFDSWYVKNWSLWTDIVILFKTVTVVLRRDGAY